MLIADYCIFIIDAISMLIDFADCAIFDIDFFA